MLTREPTIVHDYVGRPFPAFEADRLPVSLTPLYELAATADGWAADFDAARCVALRTGDGRYARREGRGRYVLLDGGGVLTSADPEAV